MFTGSSSTQLCPQQLDDILGPNLDQFEILICQLFSSDEDQVSRSKALFHLALRSRPDSLLLALSKLLSPGPPSLRAAAAKQIGEIFTTFSSSFLSTTLDALKSDLLSAFRNEASDSDVWNPLLRTISDFHATGSWPELLPYLFQCVDSHYLQKHALLVFKSLAENLNGNASLIPHLNTFQEVFSECLGNCSSWDVKIAAFDTSITFVHFIPNQNDPNRFDYLLRLMMLALTEALNSESESETEDSLRFLIKLAETDPRFFERQLEKVLQLMLKITVDDSLEVNTRHLAIEFLMALVEKDPSMIRKEPQFIKSFFDELMYMLFDIEGLHVDAADFSAEAAAAAINAVNVAAEAAAADVAAEAAAAADAAVVLDYDGFHATATAAAQAAAHAAALGGVSIFSDSFHAISADIATAVNAAAGGFGRVTILSDRIRAAASTAVAVADAADDAAAAAAAAAALGGATIFSDRFHAAASRADVAAAVSLAAAAVAAAVSFAAAAVAAAVLRAAAAAVRADLRAAAAADATAAAAAAALRIAAADATALRAPAVLSTAAAASPAYAFLPSSAAGADNGYWNEVEIYNFWESSNHILGNECLSKLSFLLEEKTIFPWVLRLFSHLLDSSIWQQRLAVLMAIPKIAKGCNKVMLENVEEIVPKVLNLVNDWHPCVPLAAIDAIRQLSVDLGPELQTQYHEIVLITLVKVMNDRRRCKLKAAAASAALSFLTNGTEKIIDLYKWRITDEFHKLVKGNNSIKENFLGSQLVTIVSMLSRDIDGQWSRELRGEYLSLIIWLLSFGSYLKKSEINNLNRLKNCILAME